MKIRIGYELIYNCPQPTPMILTLSVHYTRASDIIIPDYLITDPPIPITSCAPTPRTSSGSKMSAKESSRCSFRATTKDGRREWSRA